MEDWGQDPCKGLESLCQKLSAKESNHNQKGKQTNE